jgi:hypothetical protein
MKSESSSAYSIGEDGVDVDVYGYSLILGIVKLCPV